MGKVVSIWSPSKKTGKTLFLYMLTKHLNNLLNKNLKILICCVNLSYGNLNTLFNIESSELNLEDIVNMKIHPDNDLNLFNALARKENIFFIGSRKTSSGYANRHIDIYENLLKEFKQNFDLVLFDTIAGSENSLSNMIIKNSDYVINVINQDKEILDNQTFSTDKDIAYIVNKYKEIYPNENELGSIYKLKNIFTLPNCDTLQEMKNREKLDFYLQHNTEYNTKMIGITEFIAKKLKLEFELEEVLGQDKKKRNILSGLLGGLL